MSSFIRDYRGRKLSSMPSQIIVILLSFSFVLGYFFRWIVTEGGRGNDKEVNLRHNASNNACLVFLGQYSGSRYKQSSTVDRKCLVESKWMQLEQHSMHLEDEDHTLIDDWLFINYHDRINVLVEDPSSVGNNEPKFLIFRQTKYALEDRQSLAIIGGIIEVGEDALAAAKREVKEELNGMECNTFLPLGRYRTDVNRGMGWVNSFLASDCVHGSNRLPLQDYVGEEVGTADTEKQEIISMSLKAILENVKNGKFLEVQWSNTVALAMMHYIMDRC